MVEQFATPADYISARKREHPSHPIDLETAERALEGQVTEGIDLAAIVEEINSTDYVQRILRNVSARLPENVRALLDCGAIAVGEIDEPTFDARTVPVADGHAIVIHRGTHQFVYRIARILSTRFVSNEGGDPALPFEDTARIIAEAFWWYVETGRAFGPEYAVSAEQRQIANLITLDAMAFLLCHEIGHVVADREAPLEYRLEAQASPHLDEHGADVLGAMWALGLATQEAPRSPTKMATRYAGIEFVLQVWALLEQLGFDFGDSHPPARERLALIRLTVRETCDETTWEALTGLARGIEHLFARIGELLADPLQHESFFEAQAAAVVSELDALLERCATVPIPNYATFYLEAGDIFARGYPESLLARIAAVAAEF